MMNTQENTHLRRGKSRYHHFPVPLIAVLWLTTNLTTSAYAECIPVPSVSTTTCLECTDTFQLTVLNTGAAGYIGYDVYPSQSFVSLGWFEEGELKTVTGIAAEGYLRKFISHDDITWRQSGDYGELDIIAHKNAGWTCEPIDPPDLVVQQAPLAESVAWEAETTAIPVVENPVDPTCQWVPVTETDASGGLAFGASPALTSGCFGLVASKLVYRIQLQTPGTYSFYLRTRTNIPGDEAIYVSAIAGEPARFLVPGNATPIFGWKKSPVPYSVIATTQTLTIVLSPENQGLIVDRLVLSLDPTLTDADLDALSNDPVAPIFPYDGIAGTGFEFDLPGASSSNPEDCDELDFIAAVGANRIGVIGPGFSTPALAGIFPDSGKQALALWGSGAPTTQLTASVLFEDVDLTGVSAAQVSLRWASPAPLEFETADRGLVVTVVTNFGPILTAFNGAAIRASTAGYKSLAIPLPLGATTVSVRVAVTSSEPNEQVWVDNVLVRSVDPAGGQVIQPPPPVYPTSVCSLDPADPSFDGDGDGICGDVDNCLATSNPTQDDCDCDGIGDPCDPCPQGGADDPDGDSLCGDGDNCPEMSNPDQADTDTDGIGDACDPCPELHHDQTCLLGDQCLGEGDADCFDDTTRVVCTAAELVLSYCGTDVCADSGDPFGGGSCSAIDYLCAAGECIGVESTGEDTCGGTPDDPNLTWYECNFVGNECVVGGITQVSDTCNDSGTASGGGQCEAVDWTCFDGHLSNTSTSGQDTCGDGTNNQTLYHMCTTADGTASDQCVAVPDTTAPTLNVSDGVVVGLEHGSGTVVTLSASANDTCDDSLMVSWSIDDTLLGVGPTLTHLFEAGSNIVTAIVADDAGHITIKNIPVTVVDTCGNDETDLYRTTPPAVPLKKGVPNCATTQVDSVAGLQNWLANPVTNLDIKGNVALSGTELNINTLCEIKVRAAASLTGMTHVFMAASEIDLSGTFQATGRVELRAKKKVIVRQAISIVGEVAAWVMEAPEVDDHGGVHFTGSYCIEAPEKAIVRQVTRNSSTGGTVTIHSDEIDLHGDFLNPGTVELVSSGKLIFRQAAKLTNTGPVIMSAGGTLDYHGDLVDAGNVWLTADEFIFRQASQITNTGDVSIVVTGCDGTDWHGDVNTAGNVMVQTTSMIVRQASHLTGSGDVTIAVDKDLDANGDITANGNVCIATQTYTLRKAHDFSDNSTCVISGKASCDSKIPKGCIPQNVSCLGPSSP